MGSLGDVFLGYSALLPNRVVLGLQGEGTLTRSSVRLAGSSASTQTGGSGSTGSSSFNFGGINPSTSNGFSFSTTSSSGTLISNLTDQITSEWMVSALARARYLIDPVDLIYVIGGYTYGRFSSPAQVGIGSFQFGMNGATIGGGWERRISSSWTLRVEYRYTEFRGHDDQTVTFASNNPSASTTTSGSTTTSTFTCNTCIPPISTNTTSSGSGTGFNTGTLSNSSSSSLSSQVSASLQTVRLGIVHYFSTY
jgi:opacity protein-like surface antigen